MVTLDEARAYLGMFSAMKWFDRVAEDAKAMIAETLVALVNPNPQAVVMARLNAHGVTAECLMGQYVKRTERHWDEAEARQEIREHLAGLGFMPDEIRQYVYLSDEQAADLRIILPRDPHDRLELFVRGFVETNPEGWPGLAEMIAQYGGAFVAGDARKMGKSAVPGHTEDDHRDGTHRSIIPIAARQVYRPQIAAAEERGERLTDAERADMAALYAKMLARMGTGIEQ